MQNVLKYISVLGGLRKWFCTSGSECLMARNSVLKYHSDFQKSGIYIILYMWGYHGGYAEGRWYDIIVVDMKVEHDEADDEG